MKQAVERARERRRVGGGAGIAPCHANLIDLQAQRGQRRRLAWPAQAGRVLGQQAQIVDRVLM